MSTQYRFGLPFPSDHNYDRWFRCPPLGSFEDDERAILPDVTATDSESDTNSSVSSTGTDFYDFDTCIQTSWHYRARLNQPNYAAFHKYGDEATSDVEEECSDSATETDIED